MRARGAIALGMMALVLAACGDDDAAGVPDTGMLDGGGELDAGLDGGALDGGEGDAGALDAGEVDAGRDAGEPDGGSDAGEPDGGVRICGVGVAGECDVALQDCPSGYACYYDGVASTQCELVTVPGVDGDTCEFTDRCSAGLTCRNDVCRPYCCPDGELECADDRVCVRVAGASHIGHCLPPEDCTLAPNEGCRAGQGCYPAAPGAVGCFLAGTIAEGEACAATNSCEPGTTCLGAPGAFTCLRICRIAMGTDDCTDPEHVCNAVKGYLTDEYGVCDRP